MIFGNTQYFRIDDDVHLSCSENMTVAEFRQEVVRRHNVGSHHLDIVGEYGTTADAVCMLALMLHRVLVTEGVLVTDLATRTPKAYNRTQIALAATDFEGVQGRVSFKPGEADVQGTILLQQLRQNDTFLDVALYKTPFGYIAGPVTDRMLPLRRSILGRDSIILFGVRDSFAGPDPQQHRITT
jgi:hypothetical protein